VTVSPIRAGGVSTSWLRAGSQAIFMGPSWAELNANADLRAVAEQTGGLSSLYRYARDAIDRLDRATRFHYVLGYYPANAVWDGDLRRIEVRVRRPSATVLHRRSYYARKDLVPFDRREFLTYSRITAASAYRLPLSDVRVRLSASLVKGAENPRQVHAQVLVDPATLQFTQENGRYVAWVDIAVFVGDRRQRLVGETRKRVDLSLEQGSYERMLRDGVALQVTIDLTAPARHVKAVAYDAAADRLGSAAVEIK
jgi:hypothetical protein